MRFYTDMADERRDLYKSANKIENEIDGIECELENKEDIKITRVKILNENGEKALQKRKGSYVTIDLKKMNNISEDLKEKIINVISMEIEKIISSKIKKEDEILVVGLGNGNLIADALGSKVIENIEVTRHIKKYLPNAIDKDTRSVSAIIPRSAWYNWN